MLGSDSATSGFTVLLASVLKPVDDTRMREKFAAALLAWPNAQVQVRVHVAGRDPGGNLDPDLVAGFPRICYHSIFWGSRLGLNRLTAQGRYWRLLRAVRPTLIIVHAPELLPLTLLWQRLGRGRQFIYDIRENYALNISTQGVYGRGVRGWLAAGLRWVETRAAGRAAAVILAEASYAAELPFLARLPANRVLTLENKYQPAAEEQLPTGARASPPPDQPLRLLFSGTISGLNGVREAIALTQELRRAWPGGARLHLIGYCQQPALLRELTRLAGENPAWLTLTGGARPVPHRHIITAIAGADFGLLAYQPHPSTARCRPTKLFEYLAHGLPVLLPTNPLWEALLVRHQAGLVVDFARPTRAAATVAAAAGQLFYPQGPPAEVLWASEAKKLRHLLESLV